MHYAIEISLRVERTSNLYRLLLNLLGKLVSLLKGQGAGRSDDDISEEFIACAPRPYPPHFAYMFYISECILNACCQLPRCVIEQCIDSFSGQAQAHPDHDKRDTKSCN